MRNPILTLLFVAAAAIAGAQDLPSAPHLDLAHRGAFLLNNPVVQSQVALTAAQKGEIDKIFTALGDRQSKLLQSAKPDNKALIQADRVASEQALNVLTSAQRAKLLSRTVKEAGPAGLVAPDMVARLKLKPGQVKQIQEILDKAEEPIVQLETIIAEQAAKDPSKVDEVERNYRAERARRAKNRTAEEQKALSVLTPAQRQIWQSLGG